MLLSKHNGVFVILLLIKVINFSFLWTRVEGMSVMTGRGEKGGILRCKEALFSLGFKSYSFFGYHFRSLSSQNRFKSLQNALNDLARHYCIKPFCKLPPSLLKPLFVRHLLIVLKIMCKTLKEA